jgi:hypothetical protein
VGWRGGGSPYGDYGVARQVLVKAEGGNPLSAFHCDPVAGLHGGRGVRRGCGVGGGSLLSGVCLGCKQEWGFFGGAV